MLPLRARRGEHRTAVAARRIAAGKTPARKLTAT